jgi:hypothetical protein
MANQRSRPGNSEVRKGAFVGPEYAESHYVNPWNMGIDEVAGATEDKTLLSPTSTPVGMHALELNGKSDYDSNWEHGVRGTVYNPKGKSRGAKWRPQGKGEND